MNWWQAVLPIKIPGDFLSIQDFRGASPRLALAQADNQSPTMMSKKPDDPEGVQTDSAAGRKAIPVQPPIGVSVDSSGNGSELGFLVVTSKPNSCISPFGECDRLALASAAVEGAELILVQQREIDYPMTGGDGIYLHRARNTRADVLALMAAHLEWTEEAWALASTHAISEAACQAVRMQIGLPPWP